MPLPFLSTYLPDLALERKPVTTHSEMRLTATTKSTFFVGTVEGGKGTLFFFRSLVGFTWMQNYHKQILRSLNESHMFSRSNQYEM